MGQVLTDDLDVNGHHLVDWRYLSDIPQGGATTGQVMSWNGTSWAPATVTGSGGPVVPDLVSSVFGRVGDVVGTNQDYTSVEDWAAVSVLLKSGITLNSAMEVLHPGGIYPGFKVLDSSGLLHVLQYDETNNSWTLDGPLIIGEAGSGTDVVQIGAASTVAGTLNLGLDSIKTTLSAGFTFSRKIQVNGTVTGVSGFVGDTVSERTAAAGVTVDGLVIKDGVPVVDEALIIALDGGGAAITTGAKGFYVAPFKMTITGWTLVADQSGSIAIDVWKDTYANHPPTDADSIVTPSITAAIKNQGSGLSLAVAKGDILRFNVDSCATIQLVTLALTGVRVG